MGFEMHPLTAEGGLDNSLDFRGGPHHVDDDPLYKMSVESREMGNRKVKEGQYEAAVSNYSELIVKTRTLEGEQDIIWGDSGKEKVIMLRALAYLNLSLCFLKLEQWTHASNTATRAMQGDKEPVDPKEDVLPVDKKAKALFRRAQAQCEGFGNFDKALEDLRKAKELTPDDKAVEQMMRKCEIAVKKTEKAADKKMSGFLKKEAKSGEGIFDEASRDRDTSGPQLPKEPVKLSDGLFIVPDEQKKAQEKAHGVLSGESCLSANGEEINYEELSREINEMREERPEVYEELRDKMKAAMEEQAKDVEEAERGEGQAEEEKPAAETKTEEKPADTA